MMRFFLSAAMAFSMLQAASATTIPAGTPLVVQTTETISSDEPVGKTFGAQLARDVVVGGKVVLRAGAKVMGRVDSKRYPNKPMMLNITHVASEGQMVPVKTTEGFRAQDTRFKTRRGVPVGSGGYFQMAAGKVLEFKLAQAASLEPARVKAPTHYPAPQTGTNLR